MKIKTLVLALAALSGTTAAVATAFNIGTLPMAPSVYSNVQTVAPGAISDLYSFVFPTTANTVSASAVTVNIGTILNIDNLQVSILDSGSNTLTAGSVGGDTSVLFNYALTSGSSYFFKVTGIASGLAGGTYAFLASAAEPVPEPATFGLMFAGAALMGLAVKRRRAA